MQQMQVSLLMCYHPCLVPNYLQVHPYMQRILVRYFLVTTICGDGGWAVLHVVRRSQSGYYKAPTVMDDSAIVRNVRVSDLIAGEVDMCKNKMLCL